MANERTLISDVVVPVIYQSYTAENSPEKTAFFQSGVIVRDPVFDALARQGGRIVTMPFWKDLNAATEPSYSDDSMTSMEPDKIVADEMIARVAYLNQAYRTPDLITELAGSNPMQRIRNRFGEYWNRQYQRRILAILDGIRKDNVANDSGDMVKDISGTNADNDDDAKFNAEAAIDAMATSGDRQDEYRVLAVHDVVYAKMKKNNLIDFIPDSQGQLTIPTWMGLRVVVDSNMTTVAAAGADPGDAAKKYISIFFGAAALGYGEGTPLVPVEIERQALQGNGGGMEVIIERKTQLIHPFGFSFTSNTVTGQSPSLANLAVTANWDRIMDRKNIPLAFLITNG